MPRPAEAVRGPAGRGRVGFTVAPGETYGLLGPNGAGKTTTISMIAGLLERDDGRVVVAGRSMTTHTVQAKAAVGYVPQDLAIYPDLTARENLRFFAHLYGMSSAAARQRTDKVLEVIGLTDRAADQTRTYSGGMKRRLNIGIGLPHQGRLIVEGTRRELVGMVGERDRVLLSARGDLAAATRALAGLPAVREVSSGNESLALMVDDARANLPAILKEVAAAGVSVRTVEVAEPNLEAVFLHLTGKGLRD